MAVEKGGEGRGKSGWLESAGCRVMGGREADVQSSHRDGRGHSLQWTVSPQGLFAWPSHGNKNTTATSGHTAGTGNTAEYQRLMHDVTSHTFCRPSTKKEGVNSR